jgi:hypothetical protein
VYIVWGRSRAAVALPAALTLVNTAGFMYILHVNATAGIFGDGSPRVRLWSAVVFALDALCNVLCSGARGGGGGGGEELADARQGC